MSDSGNTSPLITEKHKAKIQFALTAPVEQLDRTGIPEDPRRFHHELSLATGRYHPRENDGMNSRETELAIVESDIAICRHYRSGEVWAGATAEENLAAEDTQVDRYVQFIVMERLAPGVPRPNF